VEGPGGKYRSQRRDAMTDRVEKKGNNPADEKPHAVSDASTGVSPPSRRKRVLIVVGVVAVVVVAAGLVSAYRYQPLSQAYHGEFGSTVSAWNGSKVAHATAQITGQLTPTVSGPITEDIWKEPTGAYNVEIVVTINNSGPHAVTIDGFGSPAPGVAKRFLGYTLIESGSYGSAGSKSIPFKSFSFAGHSSKVVVVDYTQPCTPSSAGASITSYTQMPVTYSFLGFRHTVGVPIDPYVIKRRSSCSLPSPSSRGAASAPRCTSSQLSLISDRGGWHANYAAMGQFRETLTFSNVSRNACQLSGWPRVQAVVNGAVQPTPMTLVRQSGPSSKASSPVRLAPGKTASFDIYGGDWNPVQNKACPQTTTGLLVSPPGDSTSLAVAVEEPDCGGFYVAPLIAGSSDRESWSSTVQ